MLGHAATVDDGADLEGDLVGAAQRIAFLLGHGADLDQRHLGRIEEFDAFARALGGEVGVAADDETLSGIVVRDDLRHVALVEQRELQRAALGRERLDRRRAERGDPVEAGGRDIGVDARLCDHAAVADEHDALEPEPDAQLLDLTGEGGRVAEVAFEHLDGDRAALRRAQEPEDDLRSVGTMIAAVAELRQFAAPSLQIARSDVVEHEHAVLEVAFGEDFLDVGLAAAQKVQGGVEFVLVDRAEAEHGAERVGGGRLAELARGGELGGRLDDPRHDHRQDQHGRAVRPVRSILSSPSRRTVPSAAATWPCASARAISKRSSPSGTRVSPASTRRRLSIFASGQSEMLASVRDLTLPSSR